MFFRQLFLAVVSAALLAIFSCPALAQGFKREIDAPEKVDLTVRSLDGRVSVVASDEQIKKVTIDARSAGLAIEPSDVKVEAKGANIAVDVRPRGDKDRIDIVVTIPPRSKVQIEGKAGAVDVVGNLESAVVKTDTGTIHADVPLDALKFDFVWEASRPRYMSDVEVKQVKEKAGGMFRLSGRLGLAQKKKKKGEQTEKTDEEKQQEKEDQ